MAHVSPRAGGGMAGRGAGHWGTFLEGQGGGKGEGRGMGECKRGQKEENRRKGNMSET